MKLPLLQDLYLKGASSAAILAIMACLPNLIALDTDYSGFGNYRIPPTPLPRLQRLTVRTESLDVLGPQQLWTWTRALVPHKQTLKSFTLNAFAVQGQTAIPRPFIASLTSGHGESLQKFAVGVTQMTLEAVSYICSLCPQLESLQCSVASPDVVSHSCWKNDIQLITGVSRTRLREPSRQDATFEHSSFMSLGSLMAALIYL